ncbi:MAG: hypothetical protein RLZZ422_1773 [Pseudomonadota bacterium]|jgi:copper chaperone
MDTVLEVENIRCGGCVNTITRKLMSDERITDVKVDIEAQTITVSSEEDVKASAEALLFSLGYPLRGSVQGLESFKEKARSVVSCAIGRMDSTKT